MSYCLLFYCSIQPVLQVKGVLEGLLRIVASFQLEETGDLRIGRFQLLPGAPDG